MVQEEGGCDGSQPIVLVCCLGVTFLSIAIISGIASTSGPDYQYGDCVPAYQYGGYDYDYGGPPPDYYYGGPPPGYYSSLEFEICMNSF